MGDTNKKSNRGFAAMKKEDVQRIASAGGKKTGGKNLDTAARSRGGKNSHGGGRPINS